VFSVTIVGGMSFCLQKSRLQSFILLIAKDLSTIPFKPITIKSTIDSISVDKLPIDVMSVGEMSVDEMSVDEMFVDEMSVD